MFKVVVNDTVKRYLVRLPAGARRRIREKFEFLENGLWDGGLQVKKIRGVAPKCVFEARMDDGNRILFSMGKDARSGGAPLSIIYVWGFVEHDAVTRKSRALIPDEVTFLKFKPYEEAAFQDLEMESLPQDYFTQEKVAERVSRDSHSQKWFWLDPSEWQRVLDQKDEDIELFLYLTAAQKQILKSPLPIMLSGTAGSGKTTLSVYYLLGEALRRKTKLFVTYNRYLRDFAERLYAGLAAQRSWAADAVHPLFLTYKDLCLDIAATSRRVFDPAREVDFNRFNAIFTKHPASVQFDAALVWEEIRSIIKGALPQVDLSVLKRGIKDIRSGLAGEETIRTLRLQFAWLSQLESASIVEKITRKFFDASPPSFAGNLRRHVQDYPDRVLRVLEETLAALVKLSDFSRRKYLTFFEYESIGRKKAPNFQFNRKEIYKLFEWYQTRLEADGLWDEIDVTREALRLLAANELEAFRFDVVLTDEVQDLTDVQHELLFNVARDPRRLFLAGDAKQIINPSGFRWEELKRHFFERGLAVPDLVWLTLNFRCSGSIVELSNTLLGMKEKLLGVSAEQVREDWKYKGRPPVVVEGIREGQMERAVAEAGARRTILVRTEEERNRLKAALGTELVFTITEAKGLEFDTVVLWKFCAEAQSRDVWKVILDQSNRSVREAWIKHEINLLYVGITRAQKDLIIYDGPEPSVVWQDPAFSDLVFISRDPEYIGKVWNVLSTPEEWVDQGNYFFERGYFKAAMECYKNGGDEALLARAAAFYLEKAGHTAEAAANFENLKIWDKAAALYQACRRFRKALPIWEALRNEERAEDCRIEIFKEDGKFQEAAEILDRRKEYGEAVECYMAAKSYKRAAELYSGPLRNMPEAARCFDLAGMPERAADIYRKLKDFAKAGDLYEKAGDYEKAEAVWRKLKNMERLAGVYEKTGRYSEMVDILVRFGKVETAAGILKMSMDQEAIREEAAALLKSRKYMQALAYSMAAFDSERIGDCYSRLKKYTEAALHYEKAGNDFKAGEAYMYSRSFLKAAAKFFGSAEDAATGYKSARRCLRRMSYFQIDELGKQLVDQKQDRAAAAFFSMTGKSVEAGICYSRLGDRRQALECFGRCFGLNNLDRAAGVCLDQQWVEDGAKLVLDSAISRIGYMDQEEGPLHLFKLMNEYFRGGRDIDDFRRWIQLLGLLDVKCTQLENMIDTMCLSLSANACCELFRLPYFSMKGKARSLAERKLKADISGLKQSGAHEQLALRLFLLKRFDELNDVLRKVPLTPENTILFCRSERYQEAVETSLGKEDFDAAVSIFVERGEPERAAEIFQRRGLIEPAVQCFHAAGCHAKAAELLQETGAFNRAGDAFLSAGEYERAIEAYRRKARPDLNRIARAYEKMKDYAKAAEIWKNLGETRKYERCLRNKMKEEQQDLF